MIIDNVNVRVCSIYIIIYTGCFQNYLTNAITIAIYIIFNFTFLIVVDICATVKLFFSFFLLEIYLIEKNL